MYTIGHSPKKKAPKRPHLGKEFEAVSPSYWAKALRL